MGPDYESREGGRGMSWTWGVGDFVRQRRRTWMPSSRSVGTGGCRRRHMPWRRVPEKATRQHSGSYGNEVESSLERAPARFWSWRSRRWWQVRTHREASRSYCRRVDSWTSYDFVPGLWRRITKVVKRLAKRRVRGESALVRWAPIEFFVWLAEHVVDPASAEVVGLARISVACLL